MLHLYNFQDYINEGKIEDIHTKYYAGMEPATFHQIVTADPTSIVQNGETKKMGTYTKWLLKLFQDGKLLLEDLYKATEYLTMFDKLKAQKVSTGTAADINRYTSLPDLYKYIRSVGGTGEASEDESYLLNDRYFINQGEAEVFHEDGDYLVVIPRTLKASKFYAHNTRWCTRFPEMFNVYTGEGDLYIIIDKRKINTDDDNRRMQFHFQSSQFMDMLDSHLTYNVKRSFVKMFKSVPRGWVLRYDAVREPSGTLTKVKKGVKVGFVNSDGVEVIPCIYHWVSNRGGWVTVQKNMKYGLLALDGSVAVACIFDDIGAISEDRVGVKLDGKWGFSDLEGNITVPLQYSLVGIYKESRAKVERNDKWGVIDLDGREVTPCQYNFVGNYLNGMSHVDRDGKHGVIDLNGNEVVPCRYDKIDTFEKGGARVELNGKHGYIDRDGNEYWD